MTLEEREVMIEQRVKVRIMQQELDKKGGELKKLEEEFEREHKEIKTIAKEIIRKLKRVRDKVINFETSRLTQDLYTSLMLNLESGS